MKIFNPLEIKVIDRMISYHVNLQTNCLYNILFDIEGVYGLPGKFFLTFPGENTTHIMIDIIYQNTELNTNSNMNYFINSLTRDFCNITNLLEYLEKNDYLTILYNEEKATANNYSSNGHMAYIGLDSMLQRKLCIYDKAIFVPSDKLLNLKENNYKDEEMVNHETAILKEKKQNKFNIFITILSTIIAVTSLISSIFFGIRSLKEDNAEKISNNTLITDTIEKNNVLKITNGNVQPLDVNSNQTSIQQNDNSNTLHKDVK